MMEGRRRDASPESAEVQKRKSRSAVEKMSTNRCEWIVAANKDIAQTADDAHCPVSAKNTLLAHRWAPHLVLLPSYSLVPAELLGTLHHVDPNPMCHIPSSQFVSRVFGELMRELSRAGHMLAVVKPEQGQSHDEIQGFTCPLPCKT